MRRLSSWIISMSFGGILSPRVVTQAHAVCQNCNAVTCISSCSWRRYWSRFGQFDNHNKVHTHTCMDTHTCVHICMHTFSHRKSVRQVRVWNLLDVHNGDSFNTACPIDVAKKSQSKRWDGLSPDDFEYGIKYAMRACIYVWVYICLHVCARTCA